MVHFTNALNFMALLSKVAWLCGLEVFQRIQRNVLFFKIGLRTQSIKTGIKLSLLERVESLLWVKTTFVFEKEEKEAKVWRKKMKSTTKSKAQAFFPAAQFSTFKTNSTK